MDELMKVYIEVTKHEKKNKEGKKQAKQCVFSLNVRFFGSVIVSASVSL